MIVQLFSATVTYQGKDGRMREETFPVRAYDHTRAIDQAVDYVLHVLKIKDFELRVVGG